MLNRLIPLLNELEVTTHWDVITGGNDFFEVTKAFHQRITWRRVRTHQGSSRDLPDVQRAESPTYTVFRDLFVMHDPQPAGLIRARERSGGRWIWRCHIDLSNPL